MKKLAKKQVQFTKQSLLHFHCTVSSCWVWLIRPAQHMATVSHGFPRGDINHGVRIEAAKGEKRLYHFPWFCCYSSFFPLTHLRYSAWIDCPSAVTRDSQAEEYHPQLLLPKAPHCPQSPRSTYNRIGMTTLGNGPAESHSSLPLPAWTHHGCTSAAVPGTASAVFAAPHLFASPSTSPLPRAGHRGGQECFPPFTPFSANSCLRLPLCWTFSPSLILHIIPH